MTASATPGTDLDALQQAIHRLMAAGSEQEVCEAAIRAVPDIFGVRFGGLWLYDPDAQELQLTATTDAADGVLDNEVVYPSGESLMWETFEADAAYADTDPQRSEARYDTESPIESELVVPIGEYGVLNIATLEAEAFGPMRHRLRESWRPTSRVRCRKPSVNTNSR